jgi:S-adenosylmethionine decarboxylase proenzyme
MKVDTRFFLFTFILSAIISFYAGRAMSKDILISDATASNVHDKITTSHPTLSLYPGKIPPLHKYSGIQFNDKSHNSGRVVSTHLPSHPGLPEQQQCKLKANGEKLCIIDNTAVYRPPHSENKCPEDDAATCSNNINVSNGNQKSIEEKKENDDNEEHLPAGQHLLIDIKNVDSKFLDSDVQLTKAMVDLVTQSELTLLSYHCHSLIPRGVSCVGVLLESHISFHTWPEAGVISLDLFTCGSGQLVPLVKMIESIFAVPQSESTTIKPCMRWVHKLRGFRSEDSQNILLSDMDFGSMLGETFDLKTEVRTNKRPTHLLPFHRFLPYF